MRQSDYLPRISFEFILLGALFMNAALVNDSFAKSDLDQISSGCLNSFSVGHERTIVYPCKASDEANLSINSDLSKVARILGIDSVQIQFRGCRRSYFSVKPLYTASPGTREYEITYPTLEGAAYLAPITHELAHVFQIELHGGLGLLKDNFGSLRIELAADYLTGVIFQRLNIDRNEFQHSIDLIGRFYENTFDAHGTPSQRNAAFRRGYFGARKDSASSLRSFHEKFQADIFGEIMEL